MDNARMPVADAASTASARTKHNTIREYGLLSPAIRRGIGDMEGKTETMEGQTSGGKSEVLIPPEWMREKGSTKLLDQRKIWGETMVRE